MLAAGAVPLAIHSAFVIVGGGGGVVVMVVVVFVCPPPPHAATRPATTIDENNTFADAVNRERVIEIALFDDTFIRIPKYVNVATSNGRKKNRIRSP